MGRDRKRHRESPHISAEEQGMVAMLPALRSGSTDVRSNHAVFEGESGELRGGGLPKLTSHRREAWPPMIGA